MGFVFGLADKIRQFCNRLPAPIPPGNLPMKIVLACDGKIPLSAYDDKERIVWWLGKELSTMGHEITFLLKEKVECDFANIVIYNPKKPMESQIPEGTDLVHFHCEFKEEDIKTPYLITRYDVSLKARSFHRNTVFLSDSHAQIHGASVFVYPGVDFSEYAAPEFDSKRIWYHFLGNTDQRGRNVRGAIDLAAKINARLHVIGGYRVHFRKGFTIPLSPTARFHGKLSPGGRDAILNSSKGMIFPVLWEEPFSLGVIESLFFGCPVFGTPYGALPEMLGKKIDPKHKRIPTTGTVDAFYSDYGCLSVKKTEMIDALNSADDYDPKKCHEYAAEKFSVQRMVVDYLKLYEKVLSGESLHKEDPVMERDVSDKLLPVK